MIERLFKFKVVLSYFVVFISGYLYGLLKVHKSFLENLKKHKLHDTFLKIININPDPAFLSDIIAFETVIVALLIPLSIEIISRISERYNSDVLIYVFQRQWRYKILPRLLLFNIVALIVLKFFMKEDYTNTLVWKAIAWFMLLIFICIAFIVWRVIKYIIKFVSDTNYVLNRLYQDAKKSLD